MHLRKTFSASVKKHRKKLGPSHPSSIDARLTLANVQFHLREYREAARNLEKNESFLQEKGTQAKGMIITWILLSRTYEQMNILDRQVLYSKKLYDNQEVLSLKNQLEILERLARAYRSQGKEQISKNFLSKARDLKKQVQTL